MNKDKLLLIKSYARFVQRAIRGYKNTGLRWAVNIGSTPVAKSEKNLNILIATSVSGHLTALNFEGVIAKSLDIRGANVEALICDADLPICMDCEYRYYPSDNHQAKLTQNGPKGLCVSCTRVGSEFYKNLGITVNKYKDFICQEDLKAVDNILKDVSLDEIRDFTLAGVSVGEHAYAGALRFFARGDLIGLKNGDRVLKAYFRASLITTHMIRRFLSVRKIDVCVLNHGIYVPQGLISEVCKTMGVRVVTWNPAYKKNCFIFSHDSTYHHTLMSEPVDSWSNMDWGEGKAAQIKQYLNSRMSGVQDWISFHDSPDFNITKIVSELGINPNRPLVGLLTNVIWDAQLHYPANAFTSMMDWINTTIEWFSQRQDLQLVIRIHPAEISGTVPSMQMVEEAISTNFKSIPDNVFIIPPDSKWSTYSVMRECDLALIYGTKMGVELAATGLPVVVAGEAWIRGKGITFDASSKEEYLELLDRIPHGIKMSDSQVIMALKYAYHFFFRRMIPVDFMNARRGWPSIEPNLSSIDGLKPGASRGLDVICNGIIRGAPFIYDHE